MYAQSSVPDVRREWDRSGDWCLLTISIADIEMGRI